ncbi:hypothetical protein SEA_SKOG_79 [Gordonia phage Skog]|uniref:Uncharacterized protein n=1 Tax=Gordonia phage Skog TaxID=2704033 RepID=A0A6G6XJE5_9CAUD|nr:hypothetical protein KHQ85_gp079 [Gordonia phage Skog]QIG58231.1 hypothetical protein SEA_SKOG_79 [Gordonia phage Skog]
MVNQKILDQVIEQAVHLSKTGEAHAQVEETPHGFIVLIGETDEIGLDDVITAGFGPTVDEALVRANAAMPPRS